MANLNSGYASSSSSSGEGSQRLSSVLTADSQKRQSRPSISPSPPSCYSIDTSTTSSTAQSRGLKRSNNEVKLQECGKSSNKRQKQCEDKAYAASTAFACLNKAGRKIPTIRSSCPRGLPPLSGVNMRQVTHVHSKNFSPPVFMAASLLTLNEELYSALIQATSSYYQLPSSSSTSGGGGDCDSNRTSSVTDEASSSTQEENEADRIISMGEALQITKHPRLVTLASAPFKVVHVNAAYLSLTGLPMAVVLGRPFHEIVADKAWASLQAAGGDFDLTQIHGASLKAKSLALEQADCDAVKVCVTKIGAQPSKVSHFAVELHPSANAVAASLDAPIRRAAASITAATSFGMVVA